MATTTKHSLLKDADMHTIVRWVVADVAGLPTNVTAEDVHKVAYVTATKTYYGLVAHSPVEWRAFGHADNPVVSVTEAEGVLTITQRDGTESTITLPTGGGGGPTSEVVPAALPLSIGMNSMFPADAGIDAITLRDGKQYKPPFSIVPSSVNVQVALEQGSMTPSGPVRLVGVRVKYEAPSDTPIPLSDNPILAGVSTPEGITSAISLDPDKVAVLEPLQPAIEGLALPPEAAVLPVPTFIEAEGVWEWPAGATDTALNFVVSRNVPFALITWIEIDLEILDYAGSDIVNDISAYPFVIFTGYGPDPHGTDSLERREHAETFVNQTTSPSAKVLTLRMVWGTGGGGGV